MKKKKSPPKLLLFHILCHGFIDFKIGEKLVLKDEIEDGDYFDLTREDNPTRRDDELCSGLLGALSFHEDNLYRLDDYLKEYIVITNSRKIVKGFMRI